MANTGLQPSQADIASVCDVAGVDRAQAIILLKVGRDLRTLCHRKWLKEYAEMARLARCSHTLLRRSKCSSTDRREDEMLALMYTSAEHVAGFKQAVGTAG